MKSFKTFMHEQHISQGETTSSPEFLDKEAKKAAEEMKGLVE